MNYFLGILSGLLYSMVIAMIALAPFPGSAFPNTMRPVFRITGVLMFIAISYLIPLYNVNSIPIAVWTSLSIQGILFLGFALMFLMSLFSKTGKTFSSLIGLVAVLALNIIFSFLKNPIAINLIEKAKHLF